MDKGTLSWITGYVEYRYRWCALRRASPVAQLVHEGLGGLFGTAARLSVDFLRRGFPVYIGMAARRPRQLELRNHDLHPEPGRDQQNCVA